MTGLTHLLTRVLLVAPLVLAACDGRTERQRANVLPADVASVLEDPDRIEVLSIQPVLERVAEQPSLKNPYHGHELLGRIEVTVPAERKALASEIRSVMVQWNGRAARCMFEPRHAVVATKGDKMVELLICFHCGDMEVYSGRSERAFFVAPDAGAYFDKILSAAGVPLGGPAE